MAVILRDSGTLVFGTEVEVECSDMRPREFAFGEKWSWSRRSIRVDPGLRRELKTKRQYIKRKRLEGIDGLHLADHIEELEKLESRVARVPVTSRCAVMTLAPHGQFWFHVAKVRKGNQKGKEYMERWLEKHRKEINLDAPSDIMRYFEGLYPNERFGPSIDFSPFESDSTILETGYPDSIWPTVFSAIDGQPTKPKRRDEPKSHICFGLIPSSFSECVQEIVSSEIMAETLREIQLGKRQGPHRKKTQGEDYLEPEMFDPRLLDEYMWLASAKALAGPPSAGYFKARGKKARTWLRVDEFASHVLEDLVFGTDRAVMHRSEESFDFGDSVSLAQRLVANCFDAWTLVRKILDQDSSAETPGGNDQGFFDALSFELTQLVQKAKSTKDLTRRRSALWGLLRLAIRHQRNELVQPLTAEIDKLILANPDDGEFERMRLYFTWRTIGSTNQAI
jgi:hypothetical protein